MVNETTVIAKIMDVLSRNYDRQAELSYQIYDDGKDVGVVCFKRYNFSSVDLKSIFKYWKLDWKDYVAEWRVESCSAKSVRVLIWIYKDVEMKIIASTP